MDVCRQQGTHIYRHRHRHRLTRVVNLQRQQQQQQQILTIVAKSTHMLHSHFGCGKRQPDDYVYADALNALSLSTLRTNGTNKILTYVQIILL